MNCIRCNKEIRKSLELYNGDLRCPRCLKSLVPKEGEIKIDEESDELYRLSKTFFHSYLEQAQQEGATAQKNRNAYIKSAVEYCERAVSLSHPEAMADLGFYYYKGYVNSDSYATSNYKTAYSYFKAILDPKNWDDFKAAYSDFYSENGTERALDVLRKAAYYLLDMTYTAPRELLEQEEYRMENVRKLIFQNPELKIKTEDFGAFSDASAESADDRFDRILGILDRCEERSTDTSPLFGFFLIDPALYDRIKGIDTEKRRTAFGILYMTGGKANWASIGADFEKIMRRSPKIEMYFYFFNEGCAVKNLKGLKVEEIEDLIVNDAKMAGGGLDSILEKTKRSEVVFYYDDGYFVQKSRGKLKSQFKKDGGDERDYTDADGFTMLLNDRYKDAYEEA